MKKKEKRGGGGRGREMARVRRSLSRTVVKRTVRITRERLVMTNSCRLINHKTQIDAYTLHTRALPFSCAPFLHRPCGIFAKLCQILLFLFSSLQLYSSFKNFRNSRIFFFSFPHFGEASKNFRKFLKFGTLPPHF